MTKNYYFELFTVFLYILSAAHLAVEEKIFYAVLLKSGYMKMAHALSR